MLAPGWVLSPTTARQEKAQTALQVNAFLKLSLEDQGPYGFYTAPPQFFIQEEIRHFSPVST